MKKEQKKASKVHTIYVRDEQMWARAKELASRMDKSLSEVIEEELRAYCDAEEGLGEEIVLRSREDDSTWALAREQAAEKNISLDEFVARALFDYIHENIRLTDSR
jgi:hypothetical protein